MKPQATAQAVWDVHGRLGPHLFPWYIYRFYIPGPKGTKIPMIEFRLAGT